jgi:hypothetical protein
VAGLAGTLVAVPAALWLLLSWADSKAWSGELPIAGSAFPPGAVRGSPISPEALFSDVERLKEQVDAERARQ